jgi:hypothetical protein
MIFSRASRSRGSSLVGPRPPLSRQNGIFPIHFGPDLQAKMHTFVKIKMSRAAAGHAPPRPIVPRHCTALRCATRTDALRAVGAQQPRADPAPGQPKTSPRHVARLLQMDLGLQRQLPLQGCALIPPGRRVPRPALPGDTAGSSTWPTTTSPPCSPHCSPPDWPQSARPVDTS